MATLGKSSDDVQKIFESISNPKYLYKLCLPIIVIAEGFNLSKARFSFTGTRILKVFFEIFAIGICTGLTIHFCKLIFKDYIAHELYESLNYITITAVAIPLCTFNLHGALGPVHAFHNERLEIVLLTYNTVGNNASLIAMAVFERLEKYHMMTDMGQITANVLHVGFGSVLFGLGAGLLLCKVLMKSPFIQGNPIGETISIIILGYIVYLGAHLDFLALSGDVSLIFYAIVCRSYNVFNLSKESVPRVAVTINYFLEFAENLTYFAMGLEAHRFWGPLRHTMTPVLLIFLFALIFGRYLVNFISWVLSKTCTRQNHTIKFNFPTAVLCSSGGLIKGPLAFTLIAFMAMEGDHELRMICRIANLVILISHVAFTLPHYLLTWWLHRYIGQGHETYLEKVQKKHTLLVAEDGLTVTVEPKNPLPGSYINQFLLKPRFIR
jgi:hypothetical protein